MPAAVTPFLMWIASSAFAAGTALGTSTALFIVSNIAVLSWAITAGALVAYSSYQRNKAKRQARDAWNASLQDRLVMTTLVDAQRSRVYGRTRNVDGVIFKASHGANKEIYTLVIALAGHEIDAVEQVYFADQPVTLDADGYVQTEPYLRSYPVNAAYSETRGGGPFAITLPHTPISASAVYGFGTGEAYREVQVPLTISGANVSGTIGEAGPVNLVITYQWATTASKARVTIFKGAPGQDLSAALLERFPAEDYPGLIKETDRFEGIACLMVDLTFDQDAFPSGVPNISAVMRGAKVFDPRTGLTPWSDNPALCARDWAVCANGGALTANDLDDASFIAAANACDITTTFMVDGVGKPDKLFRCGMVVRTDQDPLQSFGELIEAMAGKWAWPKGRLRVRAGVYQAPTITINEDWLSGADSFQILPEPSIDEAVNIYRPTIANGTPAPASTATGYATSTAYAAGTTSIAVTGGSGVFEIGEYVAFAGDSRRYKLQNGAYLPGQNIVLESPGLLQAVAAGATITPLGDLGLAYVAAPTTDVRAEAYILADGQELVSETTLSAVPDEWHAQHVCGVMLRDARNGLTGTVPCNMRAFPLEVFDTVAVTLSRPGWNAKVFEVIGWAFSLSGGVVLTLKETAAAIFQLDAGFTTADLTPNTELPDSGKVAPVTGLTAESGTAQLLLQADGTVVTRVRVSWDPIADAAVRDGGRIEISYRLATEPMTSAQTIDVPGDETQAWLTGLADDRYYIITARARNSLVRGAESTQILHLVTGKSQPPADVTGLVASPGATGMQFFWVQNSEPDYRNTEIRFGTVAQNWYSPGILALVSSGSNATLIAPSVGTYRAFARHRDTSGNLSTNVATVDFTVTAELALQWTNIVGRPKLFRVVAQGYSSSGPIAPGLWDPETNGQYASVVRSYVLVRISRATGAPTFVQGYDVFAGVAQASALAADLNATNSDSVVVVYSFDEPQSNRLAGGLLEAMLRCGASRGVFGSPEFHARSAYCLIGIGGCGEGNGFEAYQGAVDADPNAWIDVSFQVQYQQLMVTGMGATPRTLSDYGYAGDLDATNGATFGVNIGGQASTGDLAPGSATDAPTIAVSYHSWPVPTTGIPTFELGAVTYTNTTGRNVAIEISMGASRRLNVAAGASSALGVATFASIYINGSPVSGAGPGFSVTGDTAPGASHGWNDAIVAAWTLAPGDTIKAALAHAITGVGVSTPGSTLETFNLVNRLAVIKA